MASLRVLGALALAGYLAIAFTPLPNAVAGWISVSPDVGPADAIVVLGGGSEWPGGVLSSTSLHRTVRGIELYRAGRAPLLVLSGGARRTAPSEAVLRSALARACGVPAGAIITDERAHTTREETRLVAELLRTRGARSVLLVTDAHHMVRARKLFEREGFTVRAAPANDSPEPADAPRARFELMNRAVQEILGLLYYRAARYV
jgi:uncharacterized SAM-binding protein YcdF (DUF218 family)